MSSKPKSLFIGFRATKELKARCDAAIKKSGLKESEIGRVALSEWFTNHPAAEQQIEAVIRHRSETAREKTRRVSRPTKTAVAAL